MENTHLIVGLGNPGKGYERTRHNAGFLAVERLGVRWRAEWSEGVRFESRWARVDRVGRRVLLVQPQTYMNLSGEAVARYVSYYRVAMERLLVIVDDADLTLGSVRLRARGSSGGHHGLESIERLLGTREYGRLRIGIGRSAGPREITGHVLGRFERAEWPLLERVMERVVEQVGCWLESGVTVAMTRYNGVVPRTEQEMSE
jgi:PTH1 family peptidyl-tRNA hydrolase